MGKKIKKLSQVPQLTTKLIKKVTFINYRCPLIKFKKINLGDKFSASYFVEIVRLTLHLPSINHGEILKLFSAKIFLEIFFFKLSQIPQFTTKLIKKITFTNYRCPLINFKEIKSREQVFG